MSAAMRPADYRRMVEGVALAIAREFMADEAGVLQRTVWMLEDPGAWSLVVVGGAACGHVHEIALQLGAYVVIDPLAPAGADGAAAVVRQSFGAVSGSELPPGRRLWLFTFNVFPYLGDPLGAFERLAVAGDVAVITGWARGPVAQRTRARYLEYVFADPQQREFAADATAELAGVAAKLTAAGMSVRAVDVPGMVADAVVVHVGNREALWRCCCTSQCSHRWRGMRTGWPWSTRKGGRGPTAS